MAFSSALDDFSDAIDTTGTVGVNGATSGDIEIPNDSDFFRVDLLAGQHYVINLRGGATLDGYGRLFDPFLTLRDAAGNQLLTNDDGGVGFDSQLSIDVTNSGTFFIEAQGVGADTGRYLVELQAVGAGLAGFAQPILGLATTFSQASGWTSEITYPRLVGDINGDGFADIVGFASNGTFVSFNHGDDAAGTFTNAVNVTTAFSPINGWTNGDTYPRDLGDVNGDGFDDIIGFASNGTFVGLSNGNGTFQNPIQGTTSFGQSNGWTSENTYPRLVGDVNGDGFADIVGFASNGTFVGLSNGNGTFQGPIQGTTSFGQSNGWTSQDTYPRLLGDVNNDGFADIVGFASNGTFVGFSNGNGTFQNPVLATTGFAQPTGWTSENTYPRLLGDATGDGADDIIGFGSNGVFVGETHYQFDIV